MQIEHSVEKARFMDRLGQLTVGMGFGAEIGRLVGYLMIAEPACQTAQEVADGMSGDLAEVTGMLEGLATWQMLDRVPLRGDRTCFALKSLDEVMQQRMRLLAELRGALEESQGWLQGEARERVGEYARLYAEVEREMPVILQKVHAKG